MQKWIHSTGFKLGYFFRLAQSQTYHLASYPAIQVCAYSIYQRFYNIIELECHLVHLCRKRAFSFSASLKLYLSEPFTDKHHTAPGDPPPPDPPAEQFPVEELISKQISQQRKANIQGMRNANAAVLHFLCINTTISCICAAS